MLGWIKTCLFPIEAIEEGRAWLAGQLTGKGPAVANQGLLHIHDSPPFLLNLLHTAAVAAGDPNADYPLQCREGHRLGVDYSIAPTPAVYPSKDGSSWGSATMQPFESGLASYPSATFNANQIRAKFHEEQVLGMTIGPITAVDAWQLCGSNTLYPSSFSTKDGPKPGDPGNVRILHDETRSGINPRIWRNILDQAPMPLAQLAPSTPWHRIGASGGRPALSSKRTSARLIAVNRSTRKI